MSADSLSVTHLFLNSEESAFVETAVARLILADDQWDGAIEGGVPSFMASQGYQLPFTPAELFRTTLDAINKPAIGALTYRALDAIKNKSLKARGSLVHA